MVFFATVAVAVYKLSQLELVAQKSTVLDRVDRPVKRTMAVSVNTEGKKLFEDNCNACHATNKTDNFNFESIETRGPWVERSNLIAWTKNPAAAITKFGYANDLVTQFNGQIMPSFPHLTNAQIEAILD